MRKINVALIGHKFMGRAHTHAYTDLPIFFDTNVEIVKKVLCANEESVKKTSRQWGWQEWSLDYHEVINDPEIDLVDIAAPSAIHGKVAIEAAKAGKHIFCEKPLALTLDEAEIMTETVEKAGVVNMIGFNYRKVPALALAKEMIDKGLLGEIYHFRAIYQQDWLVDPGFPLVWRLQKKDAGYGSHGDLGAHVVDQARFLIGEVDTVCCMQETFVRKRPKPTKVDGLVAIAGDEMGEVDVDDASSMLIRFKDKKTMGYIEVTRYGAGHKNQNRIEVSGSKGSIIFNMENMNELEYYNAEDNNSLQGFRKIQVGEDGHPYMKNWWPAGHIIGYGDTFVNQAYDLIVAIRDGKMVTPDFKDGLECQKILESANTSAKTGQWEKVH